MVYFVFLWFLLLTALFYKRSGLSLCTYMFALYAISAFCSILLINDPSIHQNVPFNDPGELTFVPTFFYCVLTPLLILPFRHINFHKTNKEPEININVFNRTSYLMIFIAVVGLFAFFNDLYNALTGDLGELRQMYYDDADNVAGKQTFENLPAPIQFILGFNSLSFTAIPFFFYSICFLNKSKIFNSLLFFSSLGALFGSIIIADRTNVMFYLQMLICSYIIYKKVASKERIQVLNRIFMFIFALFAVYIVNVTISRFGDETKYTQGNNDSLDAVISYAGQGYIHFCYFYENANPNCIYYDRVLPITHRLLFNKGYEDTRDDRINKHGFFVGVFASALGVIMLDIGVIPMIIWTLIYFFFFERLFFRWRNANLSLPKVLIIFTVAAIPIFGIFYYRYYAFKIAFVNVVILAICFIFKYSKKHRINQHTYKS